jgi:hypothetical protein
VVGFLGVAGFAAGAVTLAFGGVVFAVIVGFATVAAVLMRRSRTGSTSSCAVSPPDAAVPVELGPTRATAPGAAHGSRSVRPSEPKR